ncbi:CAAX prenyl protease 2 isoform X1 [Heptranchias perlo]|uniref:CAAX prenyl protease 2 isoform X1 n=1 Tax=Heptranchias perlo TaxID=212740 RepID=UPI00355ABD20
MSRSAVRRKCWHVSDGGLQRQCRALLHLSGVLPAAGLRLRGESVRVEEPVAQGSPHCDQTSVHQRPDCLGTFSVMAVDVAATHGFQGPSLLMLMGVQLEGIFAAACLPLLLTMVLFFGPLIQLVMDYPWDFIDGVKVFLDPQFWVQCLADMRWMRNQVVAPLTEELVFRACMLPMLVPCTGLSRAIVTCPLFFGVAHFHHVIELLKFRQGTVAGIFVSAVFQFSYTAVFGAYTAFIFIRTGHLIGPVLCHSFCNYMGFPAIGAALDHPQKLTIFFFYLLGVVLFFLLLFPMTDPVFYGNLAICHLTRPDSSTSVCT